MKEDNRNLNAEDINEEKVADELSFEEGSFATTDNIKIESSDIEKKSVAKEIYEWISSIATAVVLALIINTFLFSIVQVDGRSMVPTLHHGERLIVRKIAYTPDSSDVVIVKTEIQKVKKHIVKRIIALPSQEVGFDEHHNVVINNEILEENYIAAHQQDVGMITTPIVIPKKGEVADITVILYESLAAQMHRTEAVSVKEENGKLYVSGSKFVEDGEFKVGKTVYKQDGYFVLGDNRNESADSRSFGIVPEEEIIGKAIFRFLPISSIGPIK